MPDPYVVAVVLTYRRPDLLDLAVKAVRGQTRPPDLVLVVDNGKDARDTLQAAPGLEIVETGENLGPAGGYELGFRLALERGAEKVWTVDDDVEPESECLERLLAASSGADVLIPLQRKPGGAEGHSPSWNGTLFDAAVARSVGTPRGDLFFWAEDTEFFYRIRRAGFPILPISQAVVLHRNPDARARGSARTWRLYYEVRNGLYVRLRLRHLTRKGVWRAVRGAGAKLGAILFLEPNKARSLRLWWWGFRDFLRGRLGKVVRPEDWQPPQ